MSFATESTAKQWLSKGKSTLSGLWKPHKALQRSFVNPARHKLLSTVPPRGRGAGGGREAAVSKAALLSCCLVPRLLPISPPASYNQNILSLQIQGLEVLIKLIARPSPRKQALVSRRQIKSVCFPEALRNIPTDLWYKTPTETDRPNPKQFYSPLWLVFITSQYIAKSGPAAWYIQPLLIWLHLKWNPMDPRWVREAPSWGNTTKYAHLSFSTGLAEVWTSFHHACPTYTSCHLDLFRHKLWKTVFSTE